MTALVDANVWLPILVEKHQHHASATAWWSERPDSTCCWCRPLQQTVLRLLTNRNVMGDETLAPEEAWHTWEKLTGDTRTSFLPIEPLGLDESWRKNIAGREASPKLWMDAYLSAWAKTANLAFVTFDSGFKSFSLRDLHLLKEN